METLPTQLIPEILKFLPLSKCLHLGLTSKHLEMTSYLVSQYPYLVMEGKCRLVEDLLYAEPEKDLIPDLVTLSDNLYARDEEFLWCLVQRIGWDTAMRTSSFTARSVEEYNVNIFYKGDWSTALSTAWSTVMSAAMFATESCAKSANKSAAFSTAQFAVTSAINRMINLYRITAPKKIGKAAYICAERWMLINLRVIYDICKETLDKEFPDHRERRVNLELAEENPFMQQFQRLFRY